MALEDEQKLVDFACNRAALGIGFGKKQFLRYAAALAKKRQVHFKHEHPSDKWFKLMKKRHKDISI